MRLIALFVLAFIVVIVKSKSSLSKEQDFHLAECITKVYPKLKKDVRSSSTSNKGDRCTVLRLMRKVCPDLTLETLKYVENELTSFEKQKHTCIAWWFNKNCCISTVVWLEWKLRGHHRIIESLSVRKIDSQLSDSIS